MKQSEFADKLYKALLDSGFNYTGKINLTDDEINTYRDLSPKAMVEQFTKRNKLAEKSRVLELFLKIYNVNQKNVFKIGLAEVLKNLRFDYTGYLFFIKFSNNRFISVEGEHQKTEYLWLLDTMPIFEDAEEFYNDITKMYKYKLEAEAKKYVEENKQLSLIDFFDKMDRMLVFS